MPNKQLAIELAEIKQIVENLSLQIGQLIASINATKQQDKIQIELLKKKLNMHRHG